MRNKEGSDCKVCEHKWKHHEEQLRLTAHYDEERRGKCRDCRKCRDDDDKEFLSIVKGIKSPNHTAPDREPMPV